MHRFLAGLIIATAFHILILVVPISFLPDSRAHLPKTKSIKVGFNRIVPPAPKAEFTPIAPPPETIPLLAKRMVHPPPKKTPPPKPRPKPKKRFKPKAKPVMAKKKPLPKKEAVSKPEKSVPAPAIIPYRWEPPTYPAKSAPAKKTPIATASRVRETPPPLKIIGRRFPKTRAIHPPNTRFWPDAGDGREPCNWRYW